MFAREAGSFGRHPNLIGQKFVAAFSPDRLPRIQVHREIAVDGNGLFRAGPKMHFDALGRLIVTCFMLKVLQIEIGPEFTIDARKEIQIKSSSEAKRVIVGGKHLREWFDKIRAQDESIARMQVFT